MGDVFDCGGNGVVGHERGVHNHAETFHLEVGFIQGLKGAAIIKVVIEWDDEVGVSDSSDKGSMFSGGRE